VGQTTNPERAKYQSYIDDVLSGTIVTGRLLRLAVQRHVADLATGDERGLRFDHDEACFAIRFIEMLKHSKGEWANQPLILEPWQAFIVAMLFGWKKTDGRRRFATGWVKVARKNGKSTLAAGIGMKLFVADGEEGAEVYTAATKRDQAKIVHEEAKRMVRKHPSLKRIVTINRDNLSIKETNSIYAPLGADADTTDGLNISGAIVDEVHAHKTRDLWDVIDTGTGSRRNPLLFVITTAAAGLNVESVYWEQRNYSMKVLEGQVEDDSWFAYIAELDDAIYDENGGTVAAGDDWTQEAVWIKANPNIGVSVKLDDLRRKFKHAIESPAAANNFRRKHLNQDIEDFFAWLPAGLWDANAGGQWYDKDGLLPEVAERLRGRKCWGGCDLSSVSDLTALVLAFPTEDGTIDVLPWFWCPRENAVGRSRDKRVPYMMWAQRKQMDLTEGNSVDYDAIRDKMRHLRDDYGFEMQEVAFDPHNARHILTLLDRDGFTVFEHNQGILSMNDPCKQTRAALLDRRLRHGGHKPLAWCVSNAVAWTNSDGNEKLDKQRSAEKIDGAVALVMAVHRALLRLGEKEESYYNTHPVGMV